MKRRTDTAASHYRFEALGGGRFSISGCFGFPTVTSVLERSKELFEDVPVIKIDLSGVTQADSAGLALLLEWINWARHYGREMHYFGIPAQILAIARISEVEEHLHAGERRVAATEQSAAAG